MLVTVNYFWPIRFCQMPTAMYSHISFEKKRGFSKILVLHFMNISYWIRLFFDSFPYG